MPVAGEHALPQILPVRNAQIAISPSAPTRDTLTTLTTMQEEAPSSLQHRIEPRFVFIPKLFLTKVRFRYYSTKFRLTTFTNPVPVVSFYLLSSPSPKINFLIQLQWCGIGKRKRLNMIVRRMDFNSSRRKHWHLAMCRNAASFDGFVSQRLNSLR